MGPRARRDRTYEKVKSVLWDIFPTWEDEHYDRYFKEMMWASLGGTDCPPLIVCEHLHKYGS